jgi:hypothetical protein
MVLRSNIKRLFSPIVQDYGRIPCDSDIPIFPFPNEFSVFRSIKFKPFFNGNILERSS